MRTALLLVLPVAAGGCSTDDGPTTLGLEVQASTASGTNLLAPDPHQGGRAERVQLVEVRSGRLVDVFALDPASGARQQVLEQLVIGARIASDGIDYELASALGAPRDVLTILHPAGSPDFARALRHAHEARARLEPRSLAPTELPPFPVVARNAALELAFDDLLDPRSIADGAVELLVGAGFDETFAARIVADPNHGAAVDHDGDGVLMHAPTRVLVDLAVSELEALASDPPIEANPAGLPASRSSLVADAALLVPLGARPALGRTAYLHNLAGAAVVGGHGAQLDVERDALALAFRSGGDSDVTGDVSMGFLSDSEPPSVVGEFRVELSGPVPSGAALPQEFAIPRMTWSTPCTTTPKVGDRLSAPGFEAVVVGFAAQDASGVDKLLVRVVESSGALPIPGPALLLSVFDANIDEPACFVRFTPGPSSPPATGLPPQTVVRLRFSEPMDPRSLRAFDTFRVKSVAGDPSAFELVVGRVFASGAGERFRFEPSLPLDHVQGMAETYYVELASGADGPTDLAGNPLAAALPVVPFTLDANAATVRSAGIVFRFDAVDELYDDGFAELHGQHVYDLADEQLLSRPLARFSISADRDKPIPSVMTPLLPGVQGALTPLGSKLHSLWRYVDLGFAADDESNYNVDVEGMSWAPVGGAVVSDAYDEYQISLGHSVWQPDEALDALSGFPRHPNSGLVKTYASNFLPPEPDGGTVVHPKQRGYAVNPGDIFTGISGTQLMPWPLNQGIPLDEFQYYTWRDSALLASGGALGAGVPLEQEVNVLGLPELPGSLYAPGSVRSVALPLLMEFRCYPDAGALGLNAFDVSLAANSSSRPNFRAFSSGGINTSGQPVIVDPDLQPVATGGFSPTTTPPGGATQPMDNTFFIGQLDLVTRVSRSCSVWLPAYSGGSTFAPPVLEEVLAGSSTVTLAYRGATSIVGKDTAGSPQDDITTNGANLDIYGDPTAMNGAGRSPGHPVFLDGDPTWRGALQALDGSSWFQFRVTFVGDAVTNETAALASLGFAFAP